MCAVRLTMILHMKSNKIVRYLRQQRFSTPSLLAYHQPVLLQESCDFLAIRPGGLYVDCTFGGGGHSLEILNRGGFVIGLDQDVAALQNAASAESLKPFLTTGKLEVIKSNFKDVKQTISNQSNLYAKICCVNGVLMDLGVSSHQIDTDVRGFAIKHDGPLDMRMNQSSGILTAAAVINTWNVTNLADMLYTFGDEQKSRQIAREIVFSRPLQTTGQLVEVISRITSPSQRQKTLARCFQAIRIVVNDEMGALDAALADMHAIISPGGRLVVLSYHSLEDGRVKALFKKNNHHWRPVSSSISSTSSSSDDLYNPDYSADCTVNRTSQGDDDDRKINTMKKKKKKKKKKKSNEKSPGTGKVGLVQASQDEVADNRRSRSAKLRVGERI